MAWPPSRVSCPLAAMAAQRPNAIALRGPDASHDFSSLDFAVGLMPPLGAPGDTASFPAKPTTQSVVLFLAIVRSGAIALPLNPQFPEAYLDEIMATVAIDCDPCLTDPAAGKPSVLVLTSGSTGVPKAAMLSLANLCENARLSNANIPLRPGDSWLLSLPLFHVSGLGVLFRCLMAGAAVTIPPVGADLRDTLEGVTHVSLVAAQLHRLMGDDAAMAHLRKMKAILLGGSAIPEGLLRDAHAAGLPIHTTYGLTEAASQVTTTPPGADLDTLLTAGYPLHPEILRIDDEGQILVGGPTRFLGYAAMEPAESPFDEAGYFATGDMGHLDSAGRLVVDGRRDNRFIVGGENIQPEGIERAICRLPGVRRAVVVPVPHRVFGNTAVAFVDGGGGTYTAMAKALAAFLPDYMIPRHFSAWPDDLMPEGTKVMRAPLIMRARKLLKP